MSRNECEAIKLPFHIATPTLHLSIYLDTLFASVNTKPQFRRKRIKSGSHLLNEVDDKKMKNENDNKDKAAPRSGFPFVEGIYCTRNSGVA